MTYVSYVDKQLLEGGDWSNFVHFWLTFENFLPRFLTTFPALF